MEKILGYGISGLISLVLLIGGIMLNRLFKKQDTADEEMKQDRKDVNEKLLRVYTKFDKVDEEIEAVKDNYKDEFTAVRKTITDKHALVIEKINDNKDILMEAIRDINN